MMETRNLSPLASGSPAGPTGQDIESSWTVIASRFQAARAAEEAYDKAEWMPAYHASNNGGPNIPDHVVARVEALTDARYAVEGQWILTPAPSLHDVIAKLEYARERWEGFEWPPSWWTRILEDLNHFAIEGRIGA